MWGIDAFSDPNATAKEMGGKVWKSIEGLFEKHVKLPDYVSMGNLSEGTPAIVTNADEAEMIIPPGYRLRIREVRRMVKLDASG